MQPKNKTGQIITSLILGFLFALLVYSSAFQRNFFSKAYLAFTRYANSLPKNLRRRQ